MFHKKYTLEKPQDDDSSVGMGSLVDADVSVILYIYYYQSYKLTYARSNMMMMMMINHTMRSRKIFHTTQAIWEFTSLPLLLIITRAHVERSLERSFRVLEKKKKNSPRSLRAWGLFPQGLEEAQTINYFFHLQGKQVGFIDNNWIINMLTIIKIIIITFLIRKKKKKKFSSFDWFKG